MKKPPNPNLLPPRQPELEAEDLKMYTAVVLLGLIMRDAQHTANYDELADEAVRIAAAVTQRLASGA